MRRLPALIAALLLPVAPPLLIGPSVSTGAVLLAQAPAQAQTAEAVAKVAQAISVRIEGATQGSGVLVKRDGNRYTVLTAWHVVSGQRPGEELDIYTPDGQRHKLEQGSIKRLGQVDMAVLTFISSTSYKLASVGDVESVSMGSVIFVAGFPLPSEAVNARILRLLKGDVIAYANAVIANGYQLLYSNPTLPGMSGGAVLSSQGKLVGIHGQGETDIKLSELKGVAVKTGSNQAVPITYYLEMSTLAPQMDSMALSPARSSDSMPVILPREHKSVPAISGVIAPVGFRNIQDALALAVSMLALNDYDSTIKQTSEILAYRYTWFAFYLRAASKFANRDSDGAFADVERSLAARGDYAPSYDLRSHIRESLGLKSFACNDLVLANSYGSRSAGKRLSEICLSFQYPSSFFSENGSHAFFAKASSRYVNIGTTGSWNSSVTPILVKIVSVSHPLIVLEEKSRMNSIEDTLQTTRVDINCAKFWSEPSALLYNDIPGSKNVIPYLYKYFCKKPG